jgi:cysteine-rich repeat protein
MIPRMIWRIGQVLLLQALAGLATTAYAADDIVLNLSTGPGPGDLTLSWSGTGPSYTVYRAQSAASLASPGNLQLVTTGTGWTDTPPDVPALFYRVDPPVCANGIREAGEDCDDANTVNLDACSATCRFEQIQRAIYFKMQFVTDTFCTANALGGAMVGATTRTQLQSILDSGVSAGTSSILMASVGATDLGGLNDPAFQIGFITGGPVMPGSTPYNGTSDLDWWYTIDTATLTPGRQPANLLPASIVAGALSAGPGTALLPQVFGSAGAPMRLASARVSIVTGPPSTPLSSAGGLPPGHVDAEHLDPALASYDTCGQANATSSGKLCGNLTARSLAMTPIAAGLTGCGLASCTKCYTAANTMLDALVGGCANTLIGTQISPRQPDASDPSVPIAGAGPPYTFLLTGNAVTGCRDKNAQAVDLNACLDSAAYSSYFRLATDRVIPK